jgi:hypothetical protein
MMNELERLMTTQYYSGPRYGGTIFGLVLVLVLAALGFAVFLHRSHRGSVGRIAARLTGHTPSIDNPAPAVAEKIQRLGRLADAEDSLETTIGDTAPLVIHGNLIAGVDLTQLKEDDVRIDADGHGVHVTLPQAKIFSTTLDEHKTRAYSTSVGGLVPVEQSFAPDTRARAQEKLRQDALAAGILDTAQQNARALVAALLYSLGFQSVEVS